MCGRTRCSLRVDDFPRACHLSGRRVRHLNMDRYRPSYNVSPGFNVPVVRSEDDPNNDGAVIHCMKWGLIPSFTKKNEKPDHYKMFNARSESIKEKASFRRLLPKNRCLVAVEGFYEWKKAGSKKQPYYIHFKDGRPLVFAALFDSWKNAEGEILYTFTIVTTSSSSALGWLHDRMPVIFGNKESSDLWLNGSPTVNFDTILKPYEELDLVWYPVTPEMGKSSFDGLECIKEIKLKPDETKSISQFFSKKGDKGSRQEATHGQVKHEEEPANTDQHQSMKEEPETQNQTYHHRTNPDDYIKTEEDEEYQESSASKTADPIGVIGCDQKNLKEEADESSLMNKNDDVSTLQRQEAIIKPKRGHGELLDDNNPSTGRSYRHITPPKKKGTNASDKQPTIFSYFGRS
nr:embryonic stem cell-specific 5-hydroxymethylcytosine-binding protein [Ipomoea batatas]